MIRLGLGLGTWQHLPSCLNHTLTRVDILVIVTNKKVSTVMSAFRMASVRCCL